MGWYGLYWYERTASGKPNRKRTLDNEFNGDGGTVVKSCMRGTTYYAIWQDGKDGTYTGIVCPTHMMDGELFYKPLSEKDGPLHYAAPRSFIEFLEENAPIEGDDIFAQGAREWRAKCLEHADEVRARRKSRNEWRSRMRDWRARYASR